MLAEVMAGLAILLGGTLMGIGVGLMVIAATR